MDVASSPPVVLAALGAAAPRWATLALVAAVGALVLLASRLGVLSAPVWYRVSSATIVLSALPALILGVRDTSTLLVAAAVLTAAIALALARPDLSAPPGERRSVTTPGTRPGRPWRRGRPHL